MRDERSEGASSRNACDKENIDPTSGTLSPRQKKKECQRTSVLREVTMRSAKKSVDSHVDDMPDEEISAIFDRLDEFPVSKRDFREL